MQKVRETHLVGVSAYQIPYHVGRHGSYLNAVARELQMLLVSPIPFDNVHIQLGPKVLVLVSWNIGSRK